MGQITKLILAAALVLLSGRLAAQTFKCTDAAEKITYSNSTCGELGLKDAGEVKDRVSVNPALRPPSRAPQGRSPELPVSGNDAPKADTPAAEEKPSEPERRCFVVSTPKGKVTRCNEKPEE
jgi:hypothetical protein